MSPTSSTSGMKYASISAGSESMQTIRLVALRVPVLRRVLDEVVADREHHVGLVEAGHRVVAGLQADRAERLRVVGRQQALAHERLGHRDARWRARTRAAPGAAPPRTTPLPASATGLIAPRIRSAALSSSRAAGSGRAWRRRGSGSASISAAITSSGSSMWVAPGFSRLGDLERLAHDLGDDRRVGEPGVPLGDRPHHAQEVDVLVRLLVHPLEVALAGERHERRAVEEGVGDRGHEVQRARAERAEADAGAAGQPAVDVGHVGAALLVAHRDELDRRARQRLVQVERLLARDAEDVLDALGLEALHEDVACLPRSHWVCDCNVRPCHRGRARGRLVAGFERLPRRTFVLSDALGNRASNHPAHPRCCPRRPSATADAAVRHVIRGAGFGHGIGMSQYGAYGFALQGSGLPGDPRPLLHRHDA